MTNGLIDDGSGFALEVESSVIDNPDDLHSGGNFPNKEGYAHITFGDVTISEPQDDKLRYVEVKCEIQRFTNFKGDEEEDQKGRSFNHRIFVESWEDKETKTKTQISTKAADGLKAMFYAAGVFDEASLKNEKPRFNFVALTGKQCIGKITKADDREVEQNDGTKKTYKGRHEVQWNNDFYRIGEEAVKDVYINKQIAQVGGVGNLDQADVI